MLLYIRTLPTVATSIHGSMLSFEYSILYPVIGGSAYGGGRGPGHLNLRRTIRPRHHRTGRARFLAINRRGRAGAVGNRAHTDDVHRRHPVEVLYCCRSDDGVVGLNAAGGRVINSLGVKHCIRPHHSVVRRGFNLVALIGALPSFGAVHESSTVVVPTAVAVSLVGAAGTPASVVIAMWAVPSVGVAETGPLPAMFIADTR